MKRRQGRKMVSLPYQPLEALPALLSAADIHIVAMGSKMVGIVHPCKIYGAMAVGRPILFYGPKASPLGELVSRFEIGWIIEPDADPGYVGKQIELILSMPRTGLVGMGKRSRKVIEEHFHADSLAEKFCRLVTGGAR